MPWHKQGLAGRAEMSFSNEGVRPFSGSFLLDFALVPHSHNCSQRLFKAVIVGRLNKLSETSAAISCESERDEISGSTGLAGSEALGSKIMFPTSVLPSRFAKFARNAFWIHV